MELEKTFDLALLNAMDKRPRNVSKKLPPVYDFETIERELNQHLPQKDGTLKFKRISFVGNDDSYNADTMAELVKKEITKSTMNKRWNSLPKNYRWIRITEFLEKNEFTNQKVIARMKTKLINNLLTGVIYDHKTQEIVSIEGIPLKV